MVAFFDRLIQASDNPEIHRQTTEEKSQDFLQSIKRNIELILNSRQGCSACAPDLGLKDFNDATASARSLCIEIITDIKDNIVKFEPRIKVNQIDYLQDENDQLTLTFRINCHIYFQNKLELSEFDLILNSATKKFNIP